MSWIIDFQPIGLRIILGDGKTLHDAARQIIFSENHTLYAPCGGQGLCGRCRVRIVKGRALPPTEVEQRILKKDDIKAGYRLACQVRPMSPMEVEIPAESLAGRQELQMQGTQVLVAPEPAVKRYVLKLKASSLENPLSLWQQTAGQLLERYGIRDLSFDLNLIREADALAPETAASVTLRGSTVINVHFGDKPSKPLGLAVDLGTTKVASFLVDLESGSTIASEGIMNPQIPYGEDVMSRLAYAMEKDAQAGHIAKIAADGISRLLESLLSSAGANSEDVEEAVIVGNTAMHHLLLRLPVSQLARSPYLPAVGGSIEVKARDMGLKTAPGAVIHFLPSVAGFVGGDHVAMILATRINEASGAVLGLDIGTNTEIVLARNGRLISCSCPSGPAFEGAHIHHGMRAVDGAISRVMLTDGGQNIVYDTIGNKPPIGICGSGVLDGVAELVRHGLVNDYGILKDGPRMVKEEGNGRNSGFLLVSTAGSGLDHDIVLIQKDISEIQLAKAAIASGIELLLQSAGLKTDEIDKVIVAGAFGTHLRLESAIAIGLLPALPLDRFEQVGNAAGAGSRMALISLAERRTAQKIAKDVQYLELTAQPQFSLAFARALRFPVTDETKG